jgi:hypothetical protein
VELVPFSEDLVGQQSECPQVQVVQMVAEIPLVYQMAMVWALHVAQEEIHLVKDQILDLREIHIAAVVAGVDIVDSCLIHNEIWNHSSPFINTKT